MLTKQEIAIRRQRFQYGSMLVCVAKWMKAAEDRELDDHANGVLNLAREVIEGSIAGAEEGTEDLQIVLPDIPESVLDPSTAIAKTIVRKLSLG